MLDAHTAAHAEAVVSTVLSTAARSGLYGALCHAVTVQTRPAYLARKARRQDRRDARAVRTITETSEGRRAPEQRVRY